MTVSGAPAGRDAAVTRIVNWALDNDSRLYGDEREQLRWYVAATGLHWILVPWTAAVLVWVVGGRPAAVYLSIVLAVFYVPTALCHWYVARRRVAILLVPWTIKSVVLGQLYLLPFMAFVFGAMHAYQQFDPVTAVKGAVFGEIALIATGFATHWAPGQRQHRDALTRDQD
ncbi:MAG TPA: hypothetical protein DGG94_08020 [Micromonosporaceae bacterium]|nr:hypothetical protein [Micromonosporaceae bacterium]HCU49732.1 hypothetical protein [Micromonosporaceae bacterium]